MQLVQPTSERLIAEPGPSHFAEGLPTAPRCYREQPQRALNREWKQGWIARAMVPVSLWAGHRLADSVGILMYHRIARPIPQGEPPTWNVTPARLRAQLQGLLELGFRAWPLSKVIEHHQSRRPIPRRTFVVTFDDGYENLFTQAWPVLRDLAVPATIFLATAYLDSLQPFPFDDWTLAGQRHVPADAWRPLTTAQCEQLLTTGLVELAAHTHSHADFRHCQSRFPGDIEHCRQLLQQRFGIDRPAFAFPYGCKKSGFVTPELVHWVRRSQFACGLTTESDVVRLGQDPYDWGRFTAYESDSALTLASKLDGWYSLACEKLRLVRMALGRPWSWQNFADTREIALGRYGEPAERTLARVSDRQGGDHA